MRVLLVCLDSLGEVMAASPVARVLRESLPDVHIDWLVTPASAPLVQANPYLDNVLVVDRYADWERLLRGAKYMALSRELRDFARMLSARRYDIAFDFQGTLASRAFTRLSRAKRRVGFQSNRLRERLFLTDCVERPPHATRFTQECLSLLRAIDITAAPQTPVLTIPEQDHEIAQHFRYTSRLHGPFIACSVAGPHPDRNWTWSHWGELIDLFWEREGLRTVLVGGLNQRCDALRLVESCTSQPVCAIGRLSLLQSAALMQDAALVVGCDAGLTYAGLAMDIPTTVLFGATDPIHLAEEPLVAVCFHPVPCAPCLHRPSCHHGDCLQGITAGEVFNTAAKLLRRVRIAV